MTFEHKYKLLNLIEFIIFIIDEECNIKQDNQIYESIGKFLKRNDLTFSKIESIEQEEIKDFIYCNLFNYILNQINMDVQHKNRVFKTIICYYREWR